VGGRGGRVLTNTAMIPMTITGFLPCRSAIRPQIVEVRALPNMNEAPKNYNIFQKLRKNI
jgi:hypothetical protein